MHVTEFCESKTVSETGARLLRLPQVLKLFPVSRSRWYAGVKAGEYPKPVKLSANIVAWRQRDIDALIEEIANRAASDDADAATRK